MFRRPELTGLEPQEEPRPSRAPEEPTLRQRLRARFTRRIAFFVPYEVRFGSMVVAGVVGVVGTPIWGLLGLHPHDAGIGMFLGFSGLGDVISDSVWQRLGRRRRLPAWALVPRRKGESRPSLIAKWRAHRHAVRRADQPHVPTPHAYPGRSDVTYRARNTWSGGSDLT